MDLVYHVHMFTPVRQLLCRDVSDHGVYKPVEAAHFTAGILQEWDHFINKKCQL